MSAKLFCKTGELAGAEFMIKNEATIGKNSDNDIVLHPDVISGRHAKIYFVKEENCYFLEDLHSRKGTKIDGIPVAKKEEMGKLPIIKFANIFDFIFRIWDLHKEEDKDEKLQARVQESNGTRLDRIKVTQKEKLGNLHVITFANEHKFIFQVIKSPEEPTPKPSKVVDKSAGETIFDDGESTPTPDLGEEIKNKTVFDDKVIIPPPEVEKAVGVTVFDDEPIKSPQIEKPQEKKQPGVTRLDDDDVNFPQIPDEAEKDLPAVSDEIPPAFELFFRKLKKSFELKEGENVVGRRDDCDIYLDDRSVSQPHAALIVKSGKVFIKDLQSKNKTFIGRKEVEEEIELEPGSKIRFGGVEAKLISKK